MLEACERRSFNQNQTYICVPSCSNSEPFSDPRSSALICGKPDFQLSILAAGYFGNGSDLAISSDSGNTSGFGRVF